MIDPDDKLWKDGKGYYAYLESPPAVAMLRYAAGEFTRLGCQSVLDMGCWTGGLAQALWPSEMRYTGIDYSRKAIARARSLRPGRVQFLVGDWDKDTNWHPHNGVYFGGVTSYHEDPAAWVDDVMRQVGANVGVVQDILRVPLAKLSERFDIEAVRYVYNLGLPIDDEDRQNRQIWTVTR